MRCNFWRQAQWVAAVLGTLVVIPAEMALGITQAVEFQNGANGYNGTFDRIIDERGGAEEIDGSTVAATFVDGFASGTSPSPDRQALIRFDNLVGGGTGQIPADAFIIDAQLELTGGSSGSTGSNGPWGVSGLLAPFDSSTVYGNFPAFRGPWWQDGTATRPAGNFDGAKYAVGVKNTADVRGLVQQWADGTLTNNGVAVHAGFVGTSDGWQIRTTGHGIDTTGLGQGDFPHWRPKLSVTYTTDPVEVNVFQRDLNGYTGDTMARLDGGTNLAGGTAADDDVTEDGLLLGQGFLDGFETFGNSADQAALIRFNDVFGAGTGQAPTDVPVLKAWLVLTTGDESGNARSHGAFGAYRMLTDWSTTNLHSDFDFGISAIDDSRVGADISAPLDTQIGMIVGSEVWFDVTSYLEGVRNGAADFGMAILSSGTSDGWQIHFNGSGDALARPRLVVASSTASIVVPELPGDFNENGVVDAADYVAWRNAGPTDTLPNDPTPGTVDESDYNLWRASFGDTVGGPLGSGAAVPEPASLVLGLAAAMVLISRRAAKS